MHRPPHDGDSSALHPHPELVDPQRSGPLCDTLLRPFDPGKRPSSPLRPSYDIDLPLQNFVDPSLLPPGPTITCPFNVKPNPWSFSTDDAHPLHHWGDPPGYGANPFTLSTLKYDRDHSRGSNPVRRSDAVILAPDGTPCSVPSCLLDTGASSCSYMCPTFADAYKDHLQILPLRSPASVRLGDGKTVHQITHYVLAACVFIVRGKEFRGSIVFYLFESGFDIIIGLPDILTYYPTFLASQILSAAGVLSDDELSGLFHLVAENALDPTSNLLNPELLHHPPGSLVPPWSSPPDHSTPEEDLEGPAPSVDSSYLNYLSKPYDDHVADFYQHLESVKRFPVDSFKSLPVVQQMLLAGEYLDVFCPESWHGIYPSAAPDILPLKLDFMESLPAFLKPFVPKTPERMREPFLKEWERLKTYLYRPHSGPYGAPVVAAPKPNADGTMGCRPAGDFRGVNVHIKRWHEPVARPEQVAAAVSKFRYKCDLDCKNGYHGIPLDPETAAKLAVIGPDGQYAPNFLPEGVGPATSAFCRVMHTIFAEPIRQGWCFVIIDNIIIGGDSIEEMAERLRVILDLCRLTGLTLKIEKSFFCVESCKFFGYEIGHGTTRMDTDRIQTILDIPFPSNRTQMRSFLGSALFFHPYVDHFNVLAAPLHDMTKNSFDWDDPDLRALYRPSFERLKQACAHCVQLFAPDYSLPWLIRCDASIVGSGGVLLQRLPDDHPTHPGALVPIAFCSHKFSGAATRWSTIEQEGWAIYHSVCIAFRHFVFGKSFIVESDHRNLQWMESSQVPKIVRWRLALQDFDFMVRHIPGVDNTVADYFSRLHCLSLDSLTRRPSLFDLPVYSDWYDYYLAQLDLPDPSDRTNPLRLGHPSLYAIASDSDELTAALASVHNARMGHHGAARTMDLLHRYYPGHKVPHRLVAEFVRDCPSCQKLRKTASASLPEPRSHLQLVSYPSRGWVGVDILNIGTSASGMKKLVVFVAHDTKKAMLFPVADEEAITIARCAFTFIMREGHYRGFASDPGSCFTSDVVAKLNEWLGLLHRVSLVDRHESNGVEQTNRSILRHLTALVTTERARDFWDRPEYLEVCQFLLNSYSDLEYGLSPFELTFGSPSLTHFHLPEGLPAGADKHEYLRQLNDYLSIARAESLAFHLEVLAERKTSRPSFATEFAAGDLVLFVPNARSREHKLNPSLLGPYRVSKQDRGNVYCHQVATGVERVLHISRVVPYHGNDDEEAFQLACRDQDQHRVQSILGFRGDPVAGRRFMTFLVEFTDGDQCWIQYGPDLCANEQFKNYCASTPELRILLFPVVLANERIRASRKLAIPTSAAPGEFWLDLRALGFTWYDSLKLPDSDTHTYVVKAVFKEFLNSRHTLARVYLPAMDEYLDDLDNYWFTANAHRADCNSQDTVVDERFLLQFPHVLGKQRSDRLRILRRTYSPVLAGTPANRRGNFKAPRKPRIAQLNDTPIGDSSSPAPNPTVDPAISSPVAVSGSFVAPRRSTRDRRPVNHYVAAISDEEEG